MDFCLAISECLLSKVPLGIPLRTQKTMQEARDTQRGHTQMLQSTVPIKQLLSDPSTGTEMGTKNHLRRKSSSPIIYDHLNQCGFMPLRQVCFLKINGAKITRTNFIPGRVVLLWLIFKTCSTGFTIELRRLTLRVQTETRAQRMLLEPGRKRILVCGFGKTLVLWQQNEK